MKKLLLAFPLLIFLILAAASLRGLSLDTEVLPYQMISEPMPEITLPAAPGLPAFDRGSFEGEVVLVNIFGSWCPGCHLEHPFLMALAETDLIPVYGISWRDTPEETAAWLAKNGNPYRGVGADERGRVIIDLGVTGAPETFIIDHKGRIRWRHAGPLTVESWDQTLWPLISQLRKEAADDRN